MADSSQLPSNAELQQHMKDAFTKPSASAAVLDPPPGGGGPVAEAPMGAETTPDVVGRQSSYKSPKELCTAPSSGKVSINSTYAERWGNVPGWQLQVVACTTTSLSYAYVHMRCFQPIVSIGTKPLYALAIGVHRLPVYWHLLFLWH
jgi:hypothetical protein